MELKIKKTLAIFNKTNNIITSWAEYNLHIFNTFLLYIMINSLKYTQANVLNNNLTYKVD